MNSLLASLGSEARDELAVKCDIFWNENNLYLTNEVRKQFRNSFLFFNTYLFERQENASLKDEYPEEYEIEKKQMKEEIKKLRDLPSLIEKSVDLESISTRMAKKRRRLKKFDQADFGKKVARQQARKGSSTLFTANIKRAMWN